ncbi:hypothetical protein HMI55_006366 [Coelomomyces lativittatus]|nr:hypothetical protein HMI55_006366 [Coelomomyces lativittatus]
MARCLESTEDDVPVNQTLQGATSAVALITDLQLLDYYSHVNILGHELMHVFGVKHDEEIGCRNHPGAMGTYTDTRWVKFSFCSTKNTLWSAYFQNETVSDVTNFYFENDEA